MPASAVKFVPAPTVLPIGPAAKLGSPSKTFAAPDDEDTKPYNKTSGGGLSQLRYQRIVENKRDDFSEIIVADLEGLIEQVGAKNLIAAGDEIATGLLKEKSFVQSQRDSLR